MKPGHTKGMDPYNKAILYIRRFEDAIKQPDNLETVRLLAQQYQYGIVAKNDLKDIMDSTPDFKILGN